MKIFILCALAISGALASSYDASYDKPQPYAFGYQVADHYGSHGRQESGDAYGNKAGSYSLSAADGRVRKVKYVADDNGFRAQVYTNEPGTDGKDTADATYNGPDGYGHGAVTAHKTVKVAPSYSAHSYAAPSYGYSKTYGYSAPRYGGSHGYSRSYGYTAPSYNHGHGYGHSRSYGYTAPSYSYGHGYGHSAPSYGGYSRSYGYTAPSYSYGHGYGYSAPSYGHAAY